MRKLLTIVLILVLSLSFVVFASANDDAVIAECTEHLWCGVTGDFFTGPALMDFGRDRDKTDLWWYERCSREGCDYSLPLNEIYLQFLEPGQLGHASGSNAPNHAVSWASIAEIGGTQVHASVVDRLIHSFNVQWKPIVDWMDFGVVSRLEFVLSSNAGTASASGRRSTLHRSHILANPWDTDCMIHEMIHNAQRFSGVPMWAHEGQADYGRWKFGMFNDESRWALAGITGDASPFEGQQWRVAYRGTASFYLFIERYIHEGFVEEINYAWKANPTTNFQADVLDALQAQNYENGILNAAGTGGLRGALNLGHNPRNNNEAGTIEMFYDITGHTLQDLWTAYWEYSAPRIAEILPHWIKGEATLTDATGEGNEVMFTTAANHVRGNTGFSAGEDSRQVLINSNSKYCANVVTHGPFYVVWEYDEPFVATRFIWQTANDNFAIGQDSDGRWVEARDRRMGDGWTVSGATSPDGPWTVLYTGTTDEYANFNFMYYYADLEGNETAYQYYRLFSENAAPTPNPPALNEVIQLSRIFLTRAEPVKFTDSSPRNLAALLEKSDVILATSGNLGIFAQHSPFVIPAGKTLYVESTLNIQGNAEIVIEGNLVILEGGRINNQGGGGGTITIAQGGVLVNNGHVENVTNSTFNNYGTIENNARFEVRTGVTFLECCDSVVIGNLNINRGAIRKTCQ